MLGFEKREEQEGEGEEEEELLLPPPPVLAIAIGMLLAAVRVRDDDVCLLFAAMRVHLWLSPLSCSDSLLAGGMGW